MIALKGANSCTVLSNQHSYRTSQVFSEPLSVIYGFCSHPCAYSGFRKQGGAIYVALRQGLEKVQAIMRSLSQMTTLRLEQPAYCPTQFEPQLIIATERG